MELQSRFRTDERFRMDSRFLEDDEDKGEEKGEAAYADTLVKALFLFNKHKCAHSKSNKENILHLKLQTQSKHTCPMPIMVWPTPKALKLLIYQHKRCK